MKTKKSVIKKVVVKCANFWMDEFDIDPKVFDDIYMEAATRAVDKRQNDADFKVAVVIECWVAEDVDKPEKHICYNTYFVMINSGLHIKAENFRRNFLLLHKIDLQKENLKPNNSNGGSKSKSKSSN